MKRFLTYDEADAVLQKYEKRTVDEIRKLKLFIYNGDFHDPKFIAQVNSNRDLAQRYEAVYKKLQEAARI